jgi:hypothetical protein
MAETDHFKRCGREWGHDTWSFHLLGYLAKAPEPAARQALLEALESTAGQFQLPVAAVQVWCDLMAEDLVDGDAPF